MEQDRETALDAETQEPSWLASRPAWLVWVAAGCLVFAVAGASYLWIERMRADDTLAAVQNAAVAKAERAVRRDPDDARARLALAYAYRQAGRHADAVAQSDTVLDSEPKNTSALYTRAISQLALGKGKSAEADLWDILDAEPDHVQASVALGDYYAGRKEYRSLLVAVRPVVGEHPEIARLQYLVGLGYEHTGHPDWAIARYRMALKRDPDMTEARRGLTRLDAEP